MPKYEVKYELDAENENAALSDVYRSIYVGDLKAGSVRVNKAPKTGPFDPKANQRRFAEQPLHPFSPEHPGNARGSD